MDNKIKIRKVNVEDAEEFIKLHNFIWRSTYNKIFPEEVFEKRESNIENRIQTFNQNIVNKQNAISYVAEVNGKLIGLMTAKIDSNYDFFKNQQYAEIESLYIHPDYQKIGIGSKFKNVFIKWARENGVKKYVVGVLKNNFNARKVYEKWGGKLDDHTQQFVVFDVGYDEVFYTYDLEKEQ